MASKYLQKRKKLLEGNIPDYVEKTYKEMADQIRKGLLQEENEFGWLVRRQKILLLGGWATKETKDGLDAVKETLLADGLYAKTIDEYHDPDKKIGLNQIAVLEKCCIKHQLIVFIDGVGTALQVEQEYLRETYPLQIKVLFFIEKNKFKKFKDKPNEYLADFSSIVTYNKRELNSTILSFARMRIHRLARIITKQEEQGKGLHGGNYFAWHKRLTKGRGKK